MNKILQATSRGQVTLPKVWREKFGTDYFIAEIGPRTITLTPLASDSFKNKVENSWAQYLNGDFCSQEDLTEKYGL